MKFRFLTFIFFILIILCPQSPSSVKAAGGEAQEEQPLLQFPVMSDIHIGGDYQKDRFTKALNDLQMIAPHYQAIAMVGDITNNGTEQEYDTFNNILNSTINPASEKIITMGNHEYFEGIYSPSGLNAEIYMKRFLDKTGMPGDKIYYEKWINGYHFITLGGEGFPSPDDHDHANITEEQYWWLKRTLAKNADPSKPIFVFLHQAIDHTVYGSDDWGAGFQDNRLKDILKRYPQVILFSGHSHYLLNHPRTVFQDGFTMVNSGSVAYTYSDSGSKMFSQGLLVNVYANHVEIKARDFTNSSWIQTFTIPTPFQQTYKDDEKPYFLESSKINLEKNISGDSVTLSWDAARDNTLVDKYVIKNNGEVIFTKNMEFWEHETSENRIYAEISNLSPETAYNLEISAVDAWNNESLLKLNTSFDTPKLFGWKLAEGKWRYYKEGVPVTGWAKIQEQWYFFLNDGTMYTGWLTLGNKKYYLNTNGTMQLGWKELDGKIYYFNNEGSLQLGWINDRGNWYYLKSDELLKGWHLLNNSWYFFNDKGVMKTGWIQSAGKWYYLDTKGVMKTGWIQSSGKWYFLDSKGAMSIGWIAVGDKWYYLQTNGEMKTGWLYEYGKWYYLKPDGSMAKNTTIQGYVFGNDGVWKK
ncbi:metallophosphoesterase [Neobacillus bataviensis]|uniref:metallophosphoesterase n=1 Tax=Neobacillus bataviensis TaxID=220685 RepID=UPI001CBD4C7B|nr:metallophosphoesterase [Neobacillus bataviensis]